MKPWEAEGISRATWYRRQHRKTSGETETIDETAVRETAETMGQASETETAVAETAETTAAETGETPPRETTAEAKAETKAETSETCISDADAARRAERYRAARKRRGELVASRGLKWALQDAGVPYERLQQEVDRIRQLAKH
jgi:hypothetical protein